MLEVALRDADVVAICQDCAPDVLDALVVIRPRLNGRGFELFMPRGDGPGCVHVEALVEVIDSLWLAFCARHFGEDEPYPIYLESEIGAWALAPHGWWCTSGD